MSDYKEEYWYDLTSTDKGKTTKCKICGAKKIVYIDGSLVCDACEVGGLTSSHG